MNPLKRLLGETALYGISSVLGRMINFALVPLFTEVLPSAEYGVVTELYAYVAFFIVLFTYGMETSFFRHATKHPAEASRYFNAATTSILVTSLILSGILIGMAAPIMQWLEYPGMEHLVVWLAVLLGIDAITAVPFARLRLQHKAKRFASLKLLGIGLNVGLNLFFLLLCPPVYRHEILPWLQPLVEAVYQPTWDVEYIFLSNLIANAAMALLLLPSMRDFRLQFGWHHLRPMLVYAYPLLLMGLAGVTNEMLSRTALRQLLPEGYYEGRTKEEALGIFGACYKLSIFMNLAVQAFRYAGEPFFFSRAADKNSPLLFAQVMHGFVLLGCLFLMGITFNLSWLAPLLLRQQVYLEGLHVVPILLLANLFLGVYFNLSVWFKLTDQTYFGTAIAVSGALLTVAGNLYLIPRFGYEGASFVTLGVYFVMTIASYFLGQKHYPIPYAVGRGWFYLMATCALTFLFWVLLPGHTLLEVGIKNLTLLGFIYLLYKVERPYFVDRQQP